MAAITGNFDLNMEEVLEAWKPTDAIREIIANALDEQALTNTAPIEIYEDNNGQWHIRDYGRGLQYQHLTQNENDEKLDNPNIVIGKFGVGLKDAFATFHRHGIDITIHSAHNTFTIEEAPKHGFEEISTLHVDIQEPQHDINGTDVVLSGCTAEQIDTAKQNFLRFTDETRLEETGFGEVYAVPEHDTASIYVTGLRVATEPDFLFSYNITNTTKKVRDALNRERSNVGRTAYTSRVKKILKECTSTSVADALVTDLERFTDGSTHDELTWKPIQLHACTLLNAKDDVVFATVNEVQQNADLLDYAKGDGYRVVTIPDNVRHELTDTRDADNNPIRDVDFYSDEYNESFEYDWVEPDDLTDYEQAVWKRRHEILDLLIPQPHVEDIRISETMRLDPTVQNVRGQWVPADQRIIIHRPVLQDFTEFAAVLLHEAAHAKSGAIDLTRAFELALTAELGEVATTALNEPRESTQ
jgi:hypothetical protein